MRCDVPTAERIGLSWLRAAVAPVADFGRRAEDAARPYGAADAAAARARCVQIVALAARLTPDGVAHVRAILRRVPDPVDIVSRATVGDALTDVDFFELGRFADALEATARAWDDAGGSAADGPPVVPHITGLLAPGREAGTFYLADRFAPALADARRAYAEADADATRERQRLSAGLASLIGPLPDSEDFIVMRDAVPNVPPGTRVVRETPAYRLLALEPDAAVLAAEVRRDEAAARVEHVEELVRGELGGRVADHGSSLLEAVQTLGEVDRTLARVAFTQRWGGCVPTLTKGRFAFTNGSFVPLRAALAEAGLSYTPVSIDLSGVAVLTGPNMGGKSAALATCGFLAACVAGGVPPPAQTATLPPFDAVAWIGGQATSERERLLSAFGAEVVGARDALAESADTTLLLVDEFARTTGPREGRALLVALVEALARRETPALVATHFEGVAGAAHVPHLTIAGLGAGKLDALAGRDIHAALDAVAQVMDYRIIAVAGEAQANSDALALARLLGLDPAIVDRAAALFEGAGPLARVTE